MGASQSSRDLATAYSIQPPGQTGRVTSPVSDNLSAAAEPRGAASASASSSALAPRARPALKNLLFWPPYTLRTEVEAVWLLHESGRIT